MIDKNPFQVHNLLIQEDLGPVYPRYDIEKGTQCFIVCEGAVYQLHSSPGYVTVPLMELGNSNLQDMAMAMIEAIIMEREEPVIEAASIQDAIMAGSSILDDLDLKLSNILVREGTDVPVKLLSELKVRVAFHKDVEPGMVICFPESEFLGYLPMKENKFGMLIHNPASVIPIQIKSS